MSDSRSGADSTAPRVTAERDGISIDKTFAADEFDTPAIVLVIENDRSSPVSLRVIDPLPEELDQSDIGFHPEYAAEGWTRREDGDLQLDREIEAGESIKSVYGIRLSEVQDPASLLREPEIDEVVEIAAADDESPDDAASADEIAQAVPDTDEPETTETTGDATGGATSPDDGPEVSSDQPRATHGETVDALGTPTTDGETLAEALAAELERGSVDDETLQTLNDHLSPRLAESSQVRLDDVQARMADLEAYSDALESILDTMGTDEDIARRMGTIQDDLEKVAAQADALKDQLDDTAEDLAETDEDLAALGDDLEEEIADVQSDIDSVSDAVDDLDGRVDEVDARVGNLESELESAVGDLEQSITDLRGDLEASIDDVRTDVDDLIEWRETFVGAVGGGDDEE